MSSAPRTADNAPSWYVNPAARTWTCEPPPADVPLFHAGLPASGPTPLVELPAVAAELGVRRVFVKDESTRLGLPAFKALGVSYAVHRVLAERVGAPPGPATVAQMRARAAALPPIELVAASDGNHGHALARTGRLLGLPVRILLPEAVGAVMAEAIAAEGARVDVVAADYDTTVRRAAGVAAGHEPAVLVQDTSWEGYERIPRWIVDGYATLFHEIDAQLRAAGAPAPALVAVPMGVGSLAQAAVTHYRGAAAGRATALLGVEPDTAACVRAGLAAGRPLALATGRTIMAGLNCGTPSPLAWPYLRGGLDACVTVTDPAAARAVADLARLGLSSGPCGAATLAAARTTLAVTPDGYGAPTRRRLLGVDAMSTVILLSTEASRPAHGDAAG
ncbi:diaminopropionate ammonia-lyase [Streptomyces liangshanensis]|uniref:Diaminopropionate ammonia-lyase n=1 Tax=Streptomyces liangshanensis TaxID=2717324 RepID=A0A6G9GRX8_9ACTN|nr:diaminopropionate ammonia-lyase [Streptomyces liangshanensis]QIQ00975.1 diaminopropionate ammonia-lyase [Streptomyces liangshanensis]